MSWSWLLSGRSLNQGWELLPAYWYFTRHLGTLTVNLFSWYFHHLELPQIVLHKSLGMTNLYVEIEPFWIWLVNKSISWKSLTSTLCQHSDVWRRNHIFGPIHFQNTQEGLRYPPGCRPDLEPRGPPADFVDLDPGHRETAILSACIRRQLPFVGNVWIFRGLYCTESSKVLLCIKLLQCLKPSYKISIKKISKFHMAPRCSSTWSPVSPFLLTRKKGSAFIHRIPFPLPPPWYCCMQCCRQRLELPEQYGPKAAFPASNIYRCFQEICSR